jgi:hypothetical protein
MKTASDRIFLTASFEDRPVFNLHAYDAFGTDKDRHYSALFSTTARSRQYGFQDYQDTLTEAFGGKLKIAENTLVADANSSLLRCILSPQTESQKYDEDKLKEDGYFALRAGLLEDKQKNIWKIVGEGDARQIVRLSPENYDALLNARRKNMPLLASDVSTDTFIPAQPGDYVCYFNPALLACDFGVYGRSGRKSFVISRKHKKAVSIADTQVIEAAAPPKELRVGMQKKWRELEASGGSLAGYLEYIGMLYGKNSEYYKATEQAINNLQDRIS